MLKVIIQDIIKPKGMKDFKWFKRHIGEELPVAGITFDHTTGAPRFIIVYNNHDRSVFGKVTYSVHTDNIVYALGGTLTINNYKETNAND